MARIDFCFRGQVRQFIQGGPHQVGLRGGEGDIADRASKERIARKKNPSSGYRGRYFLEYARGYGSPRKSMLTDLHLLLSSSQPSGLTPTIADPAGQLIRTGLFEVGSIRGWTETGTSNCFFNAGIGDMVPVRMGQQNCFRS